MLPIFQCIVISKAAYYNISGEKRWDPAREAEHHHRDERTQVSICKSHRYRCVYRSFSEVNLLIYLQLRPTASDTRSRKSLQCGRANPPKWRRGPLLLTPKPKGICELKESTRDHVPIIKSLSQSAHCYIRDLIILRIQLTSYPAYTLHTYNIIVFRIKMCISYFAMSGL